jgi:aminoglycoside phosphotransferase family enzyme
MNGIVAPAQDPAEWPIIMLPSIMAEFEENQSPALQSSPMNAPDMRDETPNSQGGGPLLAAKVAFLSSRSAYARGTGPVDRKETHMSWVFLAGDTVYKLKKPVRFPYLDFSTVEKREWACRQEFAINRKLAPTVYRGVVPLTEAEAGFAVDGKGRVADWLVVMRRLPAEGLLDQATVAGRVDPAAIDRLAAILAGFYRHATRSLASPEAHLADWADRLSENRRVLFYRQFDLDRGLLDRVDRVQRRFLRERAGLIASRMADRRIVDGHGDLRPEHISLSAPISIIDRLEFNPRLRLSDPFDELAALAIECHHLGAAEISARLTARISAMLGDGIPPPLDAFYRCYRATLRARLSIAHLLDHDGRSPDKWPRQALAYLRQAGQEATALEAALAGRPMPRSLRTGL